MTILVERATREGERQSDSQSEEGLITEGKGTLAVGKNQGRASRKWPHPQFRSRYQPRSRAAVLQLERASGSPGGIDKIQVARVMPRVSSKLFEFQSFEEFAVLPSSQVLFLAGGYALRIIGPSKAGFLKKDY